MDFVFKIKDFFLRYEKYVMPAGLLSGFLLDNLTLRRIDLWVENLALLTYLTLAFLGMSFLNAYEEGKFRKSRAGLLGRELVPFLLQFTFGGLFSAFLIFYSRSASIFTSWPFLIGIFWLMVGNEFFREKYSRMVFHLSVFFVALFSYTIFALPILVGSLGPLIFVSSGLVSLIMISLVALVFIYVSPRRMKEGRRAFISSIAAIYVLFNLFYFLNLIPPIPLALKDGGVYHSVEKVDSENYRVTFEPASPLIFWRDESSTVHVARGGPVYVFSAVFAPTSINTTIFHEWSRFNERTGRWQAVSRLDFQITGGRDGGYRGYSRRSNVSAGEWRVDVENSRGQVLGRIRFRVLEVTENPRLETAIR